MGGGDREGLNSGDEPASSSSASLIAEGQDST